MKIPTNCVSFDSASLGGASVFANIGDDPCLQIQVDLSAMLDGELDAHTVRRVMVHSDACPACRTFLKGIRHQMQAHKDLSGASLGAASLSRGLSGLTEGRCGERSPGTELLRRALVENRDQLARILYEMGRGFVLMGLSPRFTREVAREPVPIPDLYMRGCSLVDEMKRLATDSVGEEWVRAQALFGREEMSSAAENLARGKRLLREALMLREDLHEARIYLGHAHHVAEERPQARREFQAVLDASEDAQTRAFALENLGNVYLEDGAAEKSLPYFHELVDSGVIAQEPRFFTTYFNLALAYGLLERFKPCGQWFERLHSEFPHKRRLVRSELQSRTQFSDVIARHPRVEVGYIQKFPEWFPISGKLSLKEGC